MSAAGTPWDDDSRTLRPKLRFAGPADAETVAEIYREGFGSENEATLVETLFEDQDLIFTIVAEREGIEDPAAEGLPPLVGAASFSWVEIDDPARERPIRAAALAPIAVALPLRGRGIASGLIRAGLLHCRKRGVEAVLVLGHPPLYVKNGFSVAAAKHIEAPWSGPNFLAQPLIDGLGVLRGKAHYGAAFKAG